MYTSAVQQTINIYTLWDIRVTSLGQECNTALKRHFLAIVFVPQHLQGFVQCGAVHLLTDVMEVP